MATTPQGTIRGGKVEFERPIDLPEGSRVYVIPSPTLDEQAACRKANVWLMRHLGQVGTNKQGELSLIQGAPVWRFKAYLSHAGMAPLGPIGSVAVDATSGDILNAEQTLSALLTQIDCLNP